MAVGGTGTSVGDGTSVGPSASIVATALSSTCWAGGSVAVGTGVGEGTLVAVAIGFAVGAGVGGTGVRVGGTRVGVGDAPLCPPREDGSCRPVSADMARMDVGCGVAVEGMADGVSFASAEV